MLDSVDAGGSGVDCAVVEVVLTGGAAGEGGGGACAGGGGWRFVFGHRIDTSNPWNTFPRSVLLSVMTPGQLVLTPRDIEFRPSMHSLEQLAPSRKSSFSQPGIVVLYAIEHVLGTKRPLGSG